LTAQQRAPSRAWAARSLTWPTQPANSGAIALFAKARPIVMIDARAYHSDAHTFQRDRTDQNGLVNAGYRVQRFTWADVTQREESVAAQIAATLARHPNTRHRRASQTPTTTHP
jgi:very-short-patch-repair endonuclease